MAGEGRPVVHRRLQATGLRPTTQEASTEAGRGDGARSSDETSEMSDDEAGATHDSPPDDWAALLTGDEWKVAVRALGLDRA